MELQVKTVGCTMDTCIRGTIGYVTLIRGSERQVRQHYRLRQIKSPLDVTMRLMRPGYEYSYLFLVGGRIVEAVLGDYKVEKARNRLALVKIELHGPQETDEHAT